MQRFWQLPWQLVALMVAPMAMSIDESNDEPGPLTPAQRSVRARMAAHTMHAAHDPRDTTRRAREAFMARFERQVDPDGRLSNAERQRRAESAKRAYFIGLALKSAKARRTSR